MSQMEDRDNPFAGSSWAGKVAVITGGTQGLGLATAELMKKRGAEAILLVGRTAAKGNAAVAELATPACDVQYCQADLGSDAAVEAILAATTSSFGRVDTYINCAAATWRGTVWSTTSGMWDQMLSTNVKVPALLISGFARMMKQESSGGTMVLVSSMAHHGGVPELWPYSTSKHALETMVRGAAFSLMSEGIRVNMLSPGWMDTPAENLVQRRFHGAEDGWLERAEAKQPFGRLLKPEEVARAICFLASGESGMMTGASVDFDQTIPGVGDLPRAASLPVSVGGQDVGS